MNMTRIVYNISNEYGNLTVTPVENEPVARLIDDCDPMNWLLESTPPPVEKPRGNLQPFGIEKTFVTHSWAQGTNDRVEERIEDKHEAIAEKISAVLGDKVWDTGTDPGCVEIASKPMTSIEEAKEFFDMTAELAVKKFRLRHVSPSIVGPGGHIHVERPDDVEHRVAIRNFAMLFPYMNAFGHPLDQMNLPSPGFGFLYDLIRGANDLRYRNGYYREAFESKSILKVCEQLEYIRAALDHEKPTGDPTWELGDMLNPYLKKGHGCYRKNTITSRPTVGAKGTFEFRCFDGVSGWEEQLLHIEVAQAVFNYTKKNSLYTPSFSEMVKAVIAPAKEQVEMFRVMIGELGLPKKLFKKYEKNIPIRLELEHAEIKAMLNEHEMLLKIQ